MNIAPNILVPMGCFSLISCLGSFQLVQGKPILILCYKGSHPDLGAVLLNSHMDVVPVFEVFSPFIGDDYGFLGRLR